MCPILSWLVLVIVVFSLLQTTNCSVNPDRCIAIICNISDLPSSVAPFTITFSTKVDNRFLQVSCSVTELSLLVSAFRNSNPTCSLFLPLSLPHSPPSLPPSLPSFPLFLPPSLPPSTSPSLPSLPPSIDSGWRHTIVCLC